MHIVDLNGKWKMKRTDQAVWIDAEVPGSVYNDLLLAGAIEDPYYRDNENKILELSSYDYEYQKSFQLQDDILNADRVMLRCEGLDTLCEISVNGVSIASTDNMYRTYKFDVKGYLKAGENTIRILFRSPVEYVTRKQKENYLINVKEAVEGISHLRKAHYMFGWDWGPQLPDMGIWRNISIIGCSNGRIDGLYIQQAHEKEYVGIDVHVQLEKWCNEDVEITVNITSPEGEVYEEKVTTKNREEHIAFKIENPMLWWPNNFGQQPLYNVSVVLESHGHELDRRALRIGLRTLTVEREKDEWGESFAIRVNGMNMFAMGADYIPEDNILARCNREKTERLIKSCVEANYNCIRVWGGGFYPEDYFYDLCDEYGLIVWQDLMFACGSYDLNDAFKENIAKEAEDNMRRLRHHPSLGLWCGNNEQEVAWVEWGWSNRVPPKQKTDYIKQFEVLLPEIAKKTDPNTFYWPASPSSTGSFDKPNDENYGDMHYWGVWHGKEPFTAYRSIYPRFMSEFGIQSFPCLKTVETFTLPEDRNIFSYVMEAHQKNGSGGNEKILHYISEYFQYPKDFDSLLYVSQLIQAEGLRYGVEHWRRNRGRCMGAVYWQLNDCWPVASWASIDCFGRWKALHYSAKRFFAPILVSACEEGEKVALHVSNETVNNIRGILKWAIKDFQGNIVECSEAVVEVAALSSKECMWMDFEAALNTPEKRRTTYFEYKLMVDGVEISAGTTLFVKAKHFTFKDPQIHVNISDAEDKFMIEVAAASYAKFVELSLIHDDGIFSDNYFDLSAGEQKVVEMRKDNLSRGLTLEALKEQLKVRSYFDAY